MKKEEVLRKLDQMVTTCKAHVAATERMRSEEIWCYHDENIHITNGIEYLADAVGEKLIVQDRHNSEFPYKYSFVYRDIEIYQIDTREFLPEVHWDED